MTAWTTKLTDHQIMALIRNGLKDPKRLLAYKQELLTRARDGRLEQSLLQQVLDFQQNDSEKLLNLSSFGEAMDSKNALTIAANNLAGEQAQAAETLIELGALVGRSQAFGLMANKAAAAQAQILKRIKDGAEYKTLDLTWEKFCDRHVGMSRASADRVIANYEEFGAAYFNLSQVMRISASTYRLIAEHVDDSAIEFDGEQIPITKANAGKIADAVASLTKVIQQRDERLAEHKRDADKLRHERNAAQKAAQKARDEFIEYKQRQAARFPHADEDHSLLLDAQSLFDMCMSKLSTAAARDLSADNQARFISLTEYMYRDLIQRTHDVRERWGRGWNMADPNDLLSLDQVAPNAKNLILDHTEKTRKK